MAVRIKKILLTIGTIILTLFAVLFVIQLIDQAINGKTYAQIDMFFKSLSKINKNKCYRNSNVLLTIIHGHEENSKYAILSNKFYDSSIASCAAFKTEVGKVKIPQNIPEGKKIELQKYVNYQKSFVKKQENLLENAQKCEGYKSCFLNTEPEDISESTLLLIRMMNTELHAKERLSVGYVLTYPLIILFDYRLQKTENVFQNTMSKKSGNK